MRAIVILAALLPACAGSISHHGILVDPGDVEGVALSAITSETIDRIVSMTAEFYGKDASVLNGWTIIFHKESPIASCNGGGGCVHRKTQTIEVAVAFAADLDCLPLASPLAHEILHVLFDDNGHSGDHWDRLNELRRNITDADPLCRE